MLFRKLLSFRLASLEIVFENAIIIQQLITHEDIFSLRNELIITKAIILSNNELNNTKGEIKRFILKRARRCND